MSSRTVLIRTDPAGDFAYERPMFGAIVAVKTDPGDMDTPTIVISDPASGATIRTMTAMSAIDYWQPGSPVAVFGTLRVAVSSGGDTKTGSVRLLVET
jgi:hypothetical protein